MLQPLIPTPSPQEFEEEKLFRALFEQISGKVSAKPLWIVATCRKRWDTSAPTQSQVKWKWHILGEVRIVVVCCLDTRCVHALCLDEEGYGPWWGSRRTKAGTQALRDPVSVFSCSLFFFESVVPGWDLLQTALMHSSTPVFCQPFFSLFWVLYSFIFLSCNKVQMGDVCVFWGLWYVWLQKHWSNRCCIFFFFLL